MVARVHGKQTGLVGGSSEVESPVIAERTAHADGIDAPKRPWRPPAAPPRDARSIPTIGRPRRVQPMTFSAEPLAFEAWPDPNEALTVDWEKLPRRYRAGDDPDELLTLYRATTADQSAYGMLSNAFRLFGFDATRKAQALAHAPPWEIAGQIDRFTSSSELSPFLPAAWERSQTASWAQNQREVYEIRVPARRVLVDGDNTGNLREAMIVGAVLPEEIVGGPDVRGYPDAWRELADAWKVQRHLDDHRDWRLGLQVTTYGQDRGVRLFAPPRFVSEAVASEWQERLDAIGSDTFVEVARDLKANKRQLVRVGEGDDAMTLLFVRHQRGVFGRTDADAHFSFSIVPPGVLDA